LNQAIAEADAIGLGTVYIDFTGVIGVVDAAARIESGYQEGLGGRLRRRLAEVAEAFNASVKLGPVALSSHQRDTSSDLRQMYRLLDLPERIFERTGQRSVVIFDEFQDLMRAEGQLDGAIRSRIQHHRDSASYVFAGSHAGLMAGLFGHRERPLYGQARPVVLGRLAEDKLVSYVRARLGPTRLEDDHVVVQLVQLAAGHPQRTLLLAHYLYERLRADRLRPTELIIDVVQAALRDVDDGFRLFWDEATPEQQDLIVALAEHGSLPMAHVGRSDMESNAERGLAAMGDIVREDEQVSLSDPLFGIWVRDRVARPPVTRPVIDSRPLRVGDHVFHRGLGLGSVVEIDAGEGFGEQREYVTCEWKNGVRSVVPTELLTASPVRQLALVPADIELIEAQLASPHDNVLPQSLDGRMAGPLNDARRVAEIVNAMLRAERLDDSLKHELDGLVAVLSMELSTASGTSLSAARKKLYTLALEGATRSVRSDAAEITKGGEKAASMLAYFTRDGDVWFPHDAWLDFQRTSVGDRHVVNLGLLVAAANDRDEQRFFAVQIDGLYWLIARRGVDTRLVGLFRSIADARRNATALCRLEWMRAASESGSVWELPL
jgi:hypothetical protein